MAATKAALLEAMEAVFNGDTRRVEHARRVTEYVEQLWRQEGADYAVVIAAAVLHDIGIHEAERKYGSAGGRYQEIEGPPIARRILTELGLEQEQIEEVCEIIAHHHSPGRITTSNFGVLYDADWLVNLKDDYDIRDVKKLGSIIDRVFLTEGGKALARQVYLQESV
jgi:HD superfamily phosphodiesterase